MSYYITYQEIPKAFLKEILSKPHDEKLHDDLLDNFYNNPDTILKYRRLFRGNVMLEFNEAEITYYKKTDTFLELLRSYKKGNCSDTETRVSNGMIESYLSSEQLACTWNAIKNLQRHHPEYNVEIKLERQEIISDFPSPWEEIIEFYYSCSLNKSVAIKIVG